MFLSLMTLIACSGGWQDEPLEPEPITSPAPEAAGAPAAPEAPEATATGTIGVAPLSKGAEALGNPLYPEVMADLDPVKILDAASWRGCLGIHEGQRLVFDDGGTVYFGAKDGVLVGELTQTQGEARIFNAGGFSLVIDRQPDGAVVLAEMDEGAKWIPLQWECNEPPSR